MPPPVLPAHLFPGHGHICRKQVLSKPWLSERGKKAGSQGNGTVMLQAPWLDYKVLELQKPGCRCGTVYPVLTPDLESQKAGRRGQGDWVRPSGEAGGTWSHARNSPMPRADVDNSDSGNLPNT